MMQSYTNCWTLPQALSKFFFVRLKSDHCLALSVSHSVTPCLLCVRLDVTLACEDSRNLSLPYQLLSVLTAMLLTLEQNKIHVVDAKSKAMLLMPDENNRHVVDDRTKQNPQGGSWCQKRIFFFINIFYQIQVRSLPCFISHSFRAFVEPFVEFCVNSYYMDFS